MANAPPGSARARDALYGALLVLMGLAGALRGVASGVGAWTTWADRDVWRADRAWLDLPTSGAEMNDGPGARVPGVGLALAYKLLLSVSPEPATMHRLTLAASVMGVLLVTRRLWRAAGPVAGGAFAALAGTTPLFSELTRAVWNPAFVVLPVCVALAGVGAVVAQGRSVHLVTTALAVAIGAQMHLSIGLWGLCLAPPLLLAAPRTRATAGWAVVAGLGALVTYAPTLWTDAANGWAELSLLTHQHSAEGVRDGALTPAPGRLWAPLREAFVRDEHPWWGPLAFAQAGVSTAALASLLLPTRAAAGERRAARVLALASIALLTAYAMDHRATLASRYLAPVTLSAAAIAGEALSRLPRPRAVAMACVVAVAGDAFATWRAANEHAAELNNPATYLDNLRQLEAATGRALPDLAGRLLVARRADGAWRPHWFPLAWPLHRRGAAWPGSASGSCLLLFEHDGAELNASVREALAANLQLPLAHATARRIDDRRWLLAWPSAEPCVVSTAQPYVWSDDEEAARLATQGRPCPTVVELPATTGRTFAVQLGMPGSDAGCVPLVFAVDLIEGDDGLSVTLRSRQLRGRALNDGAYDPGRLRALVLELGDDVRLPLMQGVLGGDRAAAPVRFGPFPVPAGAPPPRLRGEILRDIPGRGDAIAPFSITLAPAP